MKDMFSNRFLKDSILVFIGRSLTSLSNLIFHLVMVRLMSPVNYGIFASLMALNNIINIPMSGIRASVVNFASSLSGRHEYAKLRYFLIHSFERLTVFGLAMFLLIFLSSEYLSRFFKISYRGPIILVGVIFAVTGIKLVALAVLQGLQRFKRMSAMLILAALLKLVLGVAFVLLGFKVNGAFLGIVFSLAIVAGISIYLLRDIFVLDKQSQIVNFNKVYKFLLPATIAILCFTVLTQVDIVLVKHFFSPTKAGYYTVASLVGKIVLFLPFAVTMVMYPKSSSHYAQNKSSKYLLEKCLRYVAILSALSVLCSLLFPGFIIKVLSNKNSPEIIPLVRLFAIAMGIFSLVHPLMFYQLSRNKFKFLYVLGGVSILHILAICIFHNSLIQVLMVLIFSSFTVLIINLLLVEVLRINKNNKSGNSKIARGFISSPDALLET
jgi:O-antigen/teichoic acid export membrane protein